MVKNLRNLVLFLLMNGLALSFGGCAKQSAPESEPDIGKEAEVKRVAYFAPSPAVLGDGAFISRAEEKQGGKDEAEGFRFPDDRGGQILSKLLPPTDKLFPPAERDVPAPRRHPPSSIEKPHIPLPPAPAEMPRLPAGKPPVLRPRPLPDDLPLAGHLAHPIPPETQTLFAGDRVRIPSVDVNQPIPVPILAQPASSRAPLDDATADASRAAALATSPQARTTPAPFLRIDLPDPFENRLKPVPLPEENVTPVHTGSRPAK